MDPISLTSLDVTNSRVLLRTDFNVPIEGGIIRDDMRVHAAIETIRWLLEKGAKVVAISHLGSPKGVEPALSLRPVARRLEMLLGEPVGFINDCIGEAVKKEISQPSGPRVYLLENLRFHEGEKKLSLEPHFVAELATLGDYYINDAFGTAHREDSSCVALARAFKGRCGMGFLMEREFRFLKSQLQNPLRPFYALIGGAKISSKLGVLEKLLEKCDRLIIFGAMAYTFLKAQGIDVAMSLYEPDFIQIAQRILNRAKDLQKPLILPQDLVVSQGLEESSLVRLVPATCDLPEGFQGVDIGPNTVQAIKFALKDAKVIFWNGPAGVFEQERFAYGTREIAQELARHSATTIIGGGDSAAAINAMGLSDKMTHVSTGGGASLELIEKENLPALQALEP